MYTFPMPLKIVVGTEAICFSAAWFLTLVGPCVSQHMFPSSNDQRRITRMKRDTYLSSEEFLNVPWQSEAVQVKGYTEGPS